MTAACPRLGIVIVTYNTLDATLACLDSLRAAPASVTTSIVVVDNGSDGTSEAIAVRHPDVEVVDAGGNVGFARAVNAGAREVSAEYILLLNPDTLALPGSLDALIEFADAHPEHGVYGGRTLDPDGELDPHSCWGRPTLWSTFCFGTGLSTVFARSRVFDSESLGSWQRDTVREVDIVTGCLLLMKRAAFLELGGMDERYFLYGEDAEFSLRAGRAGHRPVIVPDAVIVHENGGSSDSSDGSKMCMVLAGKVTLFQAIWSPPVARVGVALLVTGTWLRSMLEKATRRQSRPWTGAWRRRASWLPGYPDAEELIFGTRHSTVSST